MTICAVTIVVCIKKESVKVDFKLAISCWVVQTIGLCQVAGYFAAQTIDARIVLVAEITALSLALIAFFSGGRLINYTVGEGVRSLGTMFLVLSFLLVLVLIVSSVLDLGGFQSRFMMAIWITLAMAFFILDTQFIVDSRYVNVTVDDYVFASMKLFADFVLVFSLIIKIFS